MSVAAEHTHIFSMQHLLMPMDIPRPPPVTNIPTAGEGSDVLDLCVRKRDRSPTPPASPRSLESSRCTPEQKNYPDPPHTMMCFSSPSSQAGSDSSELSHCSEQYSQYGSEDPKNKLPRPFKAFPKDPLSLAFGVVSTDTILSKDSAEAYVEFRQKMLSRVQNQNSGTNVKMRRTSHQNATLANIDPAYWEKRRKNNEAAKRSRDARRAKEDEIAIRCAFLEQENLKLRFEISAMRHEMERMRGMVNVSTY